MVEAGNIVGTDGTPPHFVISSFYLIGLFFIGQPFQSLEIIQLHPLSLFQKVEKTALYRDNFFIVCGLS
jgi:hypothetical protein